MLENKKWNHSISKNNLYLCSMFHKVHLHIKAGSSFNSNLLKDFKVIMINPWIIQRPWPHRNYTKSRKSAVSKMAGKNVKKYKKKNVRTNRQRTKAVYLEYKDVITVRVLPQSVLPRNAEFCAFLVDPLNAGISSAINLLLQPGNEEWFGLSHWGSVLSWTNQYRCNTCWYLEKSEIRNSKS